MSLKQKSGVRFPELRFELANFLIAFAPLAAAAAAAPRITTRATVATATTETTAATTTTRRTFLAWAGDIDGQRTAIHFGTVEGLDGRLGFLRCAHGDEPKAARAAGHAIHHQVGFNDGAMGGKCVLEVVLSGFEGKISHKQLGVHLSAVGDEPLLAPHCSRLPGFKSSLKRVHLKIYHAVEVTSYRPDEQQPDRAVKFLQAPVLSGKSPRVMAQFG